MTRKIVTVVGARPQFIKAATVSRVLSRVGEPAEILIHTGQHNDENMSDVFFEELSIPQPGYHLGIAGGNHGEMTGRMLMALEPVVLDEKPDLMLVYGDTNSTLAGALVAAKLHIPVAHVEAGLRSFNRRMPEELNRIVADHLSNLLYCPTSAAEHNLHQEGISQGVYNVGDVMYDATLHAQAVAKANSDVLDRLGLDDGTYSLATIHRAENTDDPAQLKKVLSWLKRQTETRAVVLPLHPRTRKAARRYGYDFSRLTLCDPVGYIDMARLLSGAVEVYTDSGGVQKEAYFHRKPCVTLRTETEWVETVQAGWNRLWGDERYQARREINEYGDGHAAEHIVDLIRDYL